MKTLSFGARACCGLLRLRPVLCAVAAALLLSGCASNYDITLNSGGRITNVSKPKLDSDAGVYRYKDASGAERSVSAMRVRDIGPAEKERNIERQTRP